MAATETAIPLSVVEELVRCLEEAKRWYVADDEVLERDIDLALEDFRFAKAQS